MCVCLVCERVLSVLVYVLSVRSCVLSACVLSVCVLTACLCLCERFVCVVLCVSSNSNSWNFPPILKNTKKKGQEFRKAKKKKGPNL